MASVPQSNGVCTRANSKTAQIDGVLESVTEVYDLMQGYDSYHDVPKAATPKVFIKYFFVNTKTSKNSDEMLPLIIL